MPAKHRTGYRYQIYKMGINPEVRRAEYMDKINFWRTIETRYTDKRQHWLKDNAELLSAKMAADKALESLGEGQSNMAGDAGPTEDSEVSDVDSEGFADPFAQYYSSLDADERQRVKGELMSANLRRKEATESVRQSTTRRKLLWAVSASIVLLSIAYYVFVKMFYPDESEPEIHVCPGCKQDVVFPIKKLMGVLFPAANEMDEV